MTIPLPGPLHAQRDRIVELADLGYTDVWTAESDGGDGLTPLALASLENYRKLPEGFKIITNRRI
jgi:hypothetical protein